MTTSGWLWQRGRSGAEGQAAAARDALRGARGLACPSTPHPTPPDSHEPWLRAGRRPPPPIQSGISYNLRKISLRRSLSSPDAASHGSAAALPRQTQGGRTLPSSACTAPPAPRTLRSCFPSHWRQSSPFPSGRRHSPALPGPAPGPSQPSPALRGRSRYVAGPCAPSASALWDCPRTLLRAGVRPPTGPARASCPPRLWGTKPCLQRASQWCQHSQRT